MMRRVRMLISISGGRADARPWPPRGQSLEVDAGEAFQLVRSGMAAWWDGPEGSEVDGPDPAPAAPAKTVVSHSSPTAAGPPPETAPEPEPEAAPEPEVEAAPEPETEAESEQDGVPVSYAPKAQWVRWAMAHGATLDQANAMTKAELMEAYGDRA